MTVSAALDAAGRRRSPATLPGYHAGRPPRNKGMRYPAEPPTVEEIIAVMRPTPDDRRGFRLRALIVALARRAAHPGGARTDRARPRPPPRLRARPQRQGRPPPRDRHGRLGLGAAATLARRARRAARRPAVLHHRRADPRTAVVKRRRARRAAPARRASRRPAPLRPAPAAPRPRARARSRGCAPEHHPAPTRARQTSAPHPSTCTASTPRRSSPPSTPDAPR